MWGPGGGVSIDLGLSRTVIYCEVLGLTYLLSESDAGRAWCVPLESRHDQAGLVGRTNTSYWPGTPVFVPGQR